MKYFVIDPHGQEYVLDSAEERDNFIEEMINYWAEDCAIANFSIERDSSGNVKTVNFTADGVQQTFSTYEAPSE